jgi:hypothetical protein
MTMKLILTLALLFGSVNAHAYSCTEVLKGLGLTQDSLGLLGAVDVTDAKTGEVVRIFLAQTGKTKIETQERYDFSVTSVISKQSQGKLFKDLNARTNVQVLEITYPGFPKGCNLGFYGRQIGPNTARVSKNVRSISGTTIVLDASSPNSVPAMQNPLILQYHGRLID